MEGTEAMLGVEEGYGWRRVREDEPLQHLDGRAEERDGTVQDTVWI